MPKKFSLTVSGDNKRMFIEGPWDLDVTIDHDDVDHKQVERDAKRLCKLLDTYWNASSSSPTPTTH